ncbi:hypothetical protein [Paraburkholderia aspalathi]|jgi:hypothetical protein|uniref:hypothetical protein n=1 Tax=Paraburkholderia aspalathi TaxID=1324617 RepID=UPI001909FFF1|nr:hypothetical protein [Paraburkholderia aspalathi]MBK3821519.1 hypothetical protein [Paraburkholderia aspalathi]MBK3833308.1 hypothetical protein [Paraburkholderia aspalathi]MBK3838475.1 hypothetical protein [Paraburkholderia aspalathi]MBK3863077.1 hypothetical protein [Paraburkholderia aspalathi]
MKEESGFGAVPAAMKMQRAEEAEEARQKTAAPKKTGRFAATLMRGIQTLLTQT